MSALHAAIFNLNDVICGIDTKEINTILRCSNVLPDETAPAFTEGIVEYNNLRIPVIDLIKRLRLGDSIIDKKSKIIVTEINNMPIGFIVRDVTEIRNFEIDELEDTPEALKAPVYLKIIAKTEDCIISILDFAKLLNKTELSKLKKSFATIH